MFAAAAIVAGKVFDAALATAKWLAARQYLVVLFAVMLPWVLKGVFIWGFEYFVTYGREIGNYLMESVSSMTAGSYDVNIELTGVGGYLAIQTGLIDYCSIIFTGWGLYWVVAVLARTTRVL